MDVAKLKELYPHLKGLPLKDLINAKPRMLIGLDQAKFLLGRGERHGRDDEPMAQKTLLGWIVFGKNPSLNYSCTTSAAKPTMRFMFHEAIREDEGSKETAGREEELHDLVRKHFTTEDIAVMPPKDELVGMEEARAIVENQHTRWFEGPDFLKEPRDTWPIALGKTSDESDVSEHLKVVSMIHAPQQKNTFSLYDEIGAKFKAVWLASVFVIAWILRFDGAMHDEVTLRLMKEMQDSLGERVSRDNGILWRFIPAYSPWMGGAWERLIQSIKRTIEFILRDETPREDVLHNALLEAESQINRRPLTHLPVDPDDPKLLTPNIMLFGDDDRDVTAPGVFTESDSCSKLYSRRSQHLMAQLTRRWYLPEITRRTKWHKDVKAVEVDDIVIVVEPNEVRSAWKMGRVTKVYCGRDGVVRQADVVLGNGTVKPRRAVGRLAVLDLSSPGSSDGPRHVIKPQL